MRVKERCEYMTGKYNGHTILCQKTKEICPYIWRCVNDGNVHYNTSAYKACPKKIGQLRDMKGRDYFMSRRNCQHLDTTNRRCYLKDGICGFTTTLAHSIVSVSHYSQCELLQGKIVSNMRFNIVEEKTDKPEKTEMMHKIVRASKPIEKKQEPIRPAAKPTRRTVPRQKATSSDNE